MSDAGKSPIPAVSADSILKEQVTPIDTGLDAVPEQGHNTVSGFPDAHNQLAVAYRQKGMFDQSVGEYLQVQALLGTTPEQIASLKAAYARSGMRGFWLKVLEFTEHSEQSDISPYRIASYYSILDRKDESVEWLKKAYESHDGGLVAVKTDSDFDNLHSDPRFADLLRRMKLPQ